MNLITINSGMISTGENMDFLRQLDLFKPSEAKVVIIGAGAIGSFTALTLAKMGIKNLTVYDWDTVEKHNIPNQFYRISDIGKLKVDALKEIVKDFSNIEIKSINAKIKDVQFDCDFLIVAVDNMKTRKEIFESIKYTIFIKKLIDARMGAEVFKILTINPSDIDDIEMYEKTLHSDEDATEEPCTRRAIIYNILTIASFIANNVKKVIMNQKIQKKLVMDIYNQKIYI